MEGMTEIALSDAKRLLAYPPGFRRGVQQLVKPASPAAGSNFTYKISADYFERLVSLAFTYTTVGNGSQRNVNVQFQDGDSFTFNQVQVASGVLNVGTLSLFGDLQPVQPLFAVASIVGEGQQNAPAAGTTIASIASTNGGTYLVTAIVTLSGTLTAGTDNNNIQLFNGGALVYATLDNSIQLAPQTFGPYLITLPAAGSVIAKASGAATAGSVYSVQLNAVPVTTPAAFTLPDLILPSGFQVVINVTNIQAGDTLTGIGLFVEKYGSKYSHGGYELEEREFLHELLERNEMGRW
jgi:hypothetical protein